MNYNPNFLKKASATGFIIALGIIYGDIGTSPLYVFKAIVKNKIISTELIYGAISCIFWTLTLQTTFKYVFIALRADNKGEGGIMALYSLVKHKAKWLLVPAIIGASMLLADGVITPSISISNAIEGINNIHYFSQIITPGNNVTVGIVVIIISTLFFVQKFGTKFIGIAFGPIMFVWFSMLILLGLYNIVQDVSIIKSLNPYYGYKLLTAYPEGFWILGAIFICTTGAEALYSDLGHCGKINIQISWIFVKIALITNYLGQGVWLLNHRIHTFDTNNPFYSMMPEWFIIFGVIIATVATIIASQALISGSFTLIGEAIKLNLWPRVTIKFPSVYKGQLYIPSINFILWAGCMFIIFWFRKGENMESAYGFAISITMLMTTMLMAYYVFTVRKWNKILSAIGLAIFVFVEIAFLIVNSVKLIEAWVIFVFGFILIVIMTIMFIWGYSKKLIKKFLHHVRIDRYLNKIVAISNDHELPFFGTHIVYFNKSESFEFIDKRIINSILLHKPKRAEIYWFLHIERTNDPFQNEYIINQIVPNKIIILHFKLGFKMQTKLSDHFKEILQDLYVTNKISIQNQFKNLDNKNYHTDISFIILEHFFSAENKFKFSEKFILNLYFLLKNYFPTEIQEYGLMNESVFIEKTPLFNRN